MQGNTSPALQMPEEPGESSVRATPVPGGSSSPWDPGHVGAGLPPAGFPATEPKQQEVLFAPTQQSGEEGSAPLLCDTEL